MLALAHPQPGDPALYQQGSHEWHLIRCGRFNASEFHDLMARSKRSPFGPLESWGKVVDAVAIQRITGRIPDEINAKALEHGRHWEGTARQQYEILTGEIISETGYRIHPDHPMVGASADGLIGRDGGAEIKSPFNPAVHLATLAAGRMPENHMAQVQGGMWVHERDWWDFLSYCHDFPPGHRLFVQRVYRDEAYIKRLAAEIERAEEAVQVLLAKYDFSAPPPPEGFVRGRDFLPTPAPLLAA